MYVKTPINTKIQQELTVKEQRLMEIQYLSLKSLIPYGKNPRNNTPAIEAVAESIKTFGFKVPIVIDKDNVIVAGHTRYKASQKLGLDKVPCIVASDLTPEQIKAFRLADNKTAELAEWDTSLLSLELKDLDLDMTIFGFDLESLEPVNELDNIQDDYCNIAPPTEPKTQLGDIYQLGNHRLICGDCTDPSVLSQLLDGQSADLVVTDPPYNVDISNVQDGVEAVKRKEMGIEGRTARERTQRRGERAIANDKMSNSDFATFLDKAFASIHQHTKAGGAIYVFYSSSETLNFTNAFNKHFINYEQLIWVKHHFSLSRKDYHYKHEPIIYGYKDGAKHYFTDDRTQTTVQDDGEIDYKKLTKTQAVNMLKQLLNNQNQETTVLYENKPEASELHPTMKPIKLTARLIRNSSRANEIVLDPFGGSGSTLMACEQLNRKAYLCELETKYCDVIIERYEKFTGNKVVKVQK